MSNRQGGKAPMGVTPKSAVAKAKPRSGGRFTPTGGKTITAASTASTSSPPAPAQRSIGGKTITSYYNSAKPSSATERPRKPLPSAPYATPPRSSAQGAQGAQPRQYTGGKFVPGYTPQGFGVGQHQRQAFEDSESEEDNKSEDDDEAEDEIQPEAEYDDDEDVYDDLGVRVKKESKLVDDSEFQPDEDFEDEGMDYTVIEDFAPNQRGRGGARGRSGGKSVGGSRTERGSCSASKIHYKKKIRKDSSRFTTTTAMIDGDDEFHPKVAAFMGRKIVGAGNGRKGGRKLIRWTSATDQLLLLCFHHELAMMRDDLPYQQVAERMFPEKCATGGAVKERFAKLRIEMLNRGSWVPPIIGKSPQGIRPNVRGVVRIAPGVDKGRYVLWKEDASKLIDPKDVMKGYAAAQARGADAPGRVWISAEAKREFYVKKAELESRGLVPLANVPVDYDDDEEGENASRSDRRGSMEDEQAQYDEDEEDSFVTPAQTIATPNRKRKMQSAPTTAAKRSAAGKARGHTGRKVLSVEDDDVFGAGQGNGSPKPRTRRSPQRGDVRAIANMATSRCMAPSPEGNLRGGDLGSNMMSFDPDEKTHPVRRVVILTHVPSRILANFPDGQQGPGNEKYFLDEVLDKTWAGKKNPEADIVVNAQGIDASKTKDLPLDHPDHFLYNSGIIPPSDEPFWKADREISELVTLADNIVDEETRPADMIDQVFDGSRFWIVDNVIEEYKANTNPETGVARDVNIWYRCATILHHATSGEQYETAKLAKVEPDQAAAQNLFPNFNMFPDQNAMAALDVDLNAHAGLNPYQAFDYGSAGNGNQEFMHSGDLSNFNAASPFIPNGMAMNAGMYNQGNYSGQQMYHSGNMSIAGMSNLGGASVGNFVALQALPEMSAEEMNNAIEMYTQVPDVEGGAEVDAVGDAGVEDESTSPAPHPDVEMF